MRMSTIAAMQLKLTTCEVDNMGTEQNVQYMANMNYN